MSYTGGELAPLFDPALARRAVRQMADTGGGWLYERIVENTPVSYTNRGLQYGGYPVSREPGTLKRSWRRGPVEATTSGVTDGFKVDVETHDPIARFVEDDTQPHIIRPKMPGGVLVFRTWPTGELVHAKVVHHPGTKGQHMVKLAVYRGELQFEDILRGDVEEWATEAAAKGEAQR